MLGRTANPLGKVLIRCKKIEIVCQSDVYSAVTVWHCVSGDVASLNMLFPTDVAKMHLIDKALGANVSLKCAHGSFEGF